MPRISDEARSAAAFRAGVTRRPPPRRLSAAAKVIWREIINDRPIDFFRAGNIELLEQYCELTVQQRKVIKELTSAQSADYSVKLKEAKDLTKMVVALATKLRLTVLADIDSRQVGKLKERGDGPADNPVDRLIGGQAVWGDRPQ
jgi:hypothetical protein